MKLYSIKYTKLFIFSLKECNKINDCDLCYKDKDSNLRCSVC